MRRPLAAERCAALVAIGELWLQASEGFRRRGGEEAREGEGTLDACSVGCSLARSRRVRKDEFQGEQSSGLGSLSTASTPQDLRSLQRMERGKKMGFV